MVYRILYFFLFLILGVFAARGVSAKILLPSAAGYHAGWTGTYADVDEYPVNDGDTTHASTTIENALQSYNFADNSDSGTIDGVRVVAYAKAASAPAENLRLFLRIAGTDREALTDCASLNTTTYTWCSYYWATNPSNSLNWTTPDLTALEAGFKTIANGTWDGAEHRVSQIYIDVDFRVETKKIKYHLVQKILPVNGAVDDSFTFSIADPIDEVQSAFIEIKGLATPASVNLGVAVNDSAATPGSYDATYNINSTGRPTFFRVVHDVTDYFKPFITSSGTYTRYIHLNTNNNVYLLNAKLTITYTWIIPPQVVGDYPIYGTLISATFDTNTDGAAFNSIMWKGTLGGSGQNQGRVRFQLLASNSASGPWDSNNFVGGSNCTNADWFESPFSAPDTPIEVKCYSQLNNKRYFRYKTQICSNNCSDSGNYTPTVNDAVVSWSP